MLECTSAVIGAARLARREDRGVPERASRDAAVDERRHRVDADGSGSISRQELVDAHQGGDYEALMAKLDAVAGRVL